MFETMRVCFDTDKEVKEFVGIMVSINKEMGSKMIAAIVGPTALEVKDIPNHKAWMELNRYKSIHDVIEKERNDIYYEKVKEENRMKKLVKRHDDFMETFGSIHFGCL